MTPEEQEAKDAIIRHMNAETAEEILRDPLHMTDLGNAERFAQNHHERAKFSAGSWYVWDGRRWKKDDTEAVRRLAHSTIKWMYAEAKAIVDEKRQEAFLKFCRRSEGSTSITNMLREAQVHPKIQIQSDRLDSPQTKYLFNCQNGTLDVRTGELLRHDPTHLITRLAPVKYEPSPDCSKWIAFLERIIPNPDTRAFLQRFIGSALTGDTLDQQFVILHGTGANGKSTLISVLLTMLGDYGRQANFETFLAQDSTRKGSARPDLMALKNARFVAAIEAGAGKRLDETTVKSMTGNDLITARELYREEISFTPECKIALVANNQPDIYGNDTAIWRRVLEIPFNVEIPEEERDHTLKDTLSTPTHLTSVLSWAALGALDWLEGKPGNRLNPPSEVVKATQEYREDQDHLGAYLEARAEKDPNSRVDGVTLWSNYLEWADSEKINHVGRKTLSRLMYSAGFKQHRTKKTRQWIGLKLIT